MISKETRVTRTTEGTCHWPWIEEITFGQDFILLNHGRECRGFYWRVP